MRLWSRRWSYTDFNVCINRFDIISSEWARLHSLDSGESKWLKLKTPGHGIVLTFDRSQCYIYMSEAISEWDCLMCLEYYWCASSIIVREAIDLIKSVWHLDWHLELWGISHILVPSLTAWCQPHWTNGFVKKHWVPVIRYRSFFLKWRETRLKRSYWR